MNTEIRPIPVACVPAALTRAEHSRTSALRQSLVERIEETRDHSQGYSFRLRGEPNVFTLAAEWITLKRRCCPFLVFQLEWAQDDSFAWLHLSGPEGTREFLKAEMPALPLE